MSSITGSAGPRRILHALIGAAVFSASGASAQAQLRLNTWSIAAIDTATGDVGVAVASCVPEVHVDAVAALVPGVGVAATQALWDLDNRNRVYAALRDGDGAGEIVALVADAEVDPLLGQRQYAIITFSDGNIEIAGFTGDDAPDWSGIRTDADNAVTVQGNTLFSEAVVADALSAFIDTDPDGRNGLSDRLMRALEAGSAAGGDRRCNRDGIGPTAATAAILVARADDPPYATADIMRTDQGTTAAPWLAISEIAPIDGPNPLIELRRRYDQWRELATF